MPAAPLRRIGIVAPTSALPGGHAVQAERLLAAWRADTEFDVCLVPIDPAPPPRLAWTVRVRYLRTLVTQLRYWSLLLRRVPGLHAVHVFCPSNGSFHRSALPAMLVARLCGVPVIANHRGDATTQLRSSAVVRWLLRGAAANVAPSRHFGDALGALGLRATEIPNVADLARFGYRPRTTLAPRLLSTRHLAPIYDVACTLRAFALVQRRHPDATLVVVGDGREAPALRRLAGELGLRGVTFAGRVPQRAMPRYYDDADVYVQTPTMDNFPASVVEAFACGLPVVATAVGGVPWLLEHGVHGLLAPAGDHAAVAAQVLALVADPARARRMAAAARATCARLDAPVVREAWRTVYRDVARRPAVHEAVEHPAADPRPRRTALVTGASSGIGEAYAEVLAEHGIDLVLTARRADRLDAIAARLERAHGVRAIVVPADLAAPAAVAGLCAAIEARGIAIDVLVNAAGFGAAGGALASSWQEHAAMLQVMAVAPAELARRLVPAMVARGYGRVVNVASLAGLVDAGAGATYSAAKSCLVAFSTALHREVRAHGVHVTAVCPGLVRSGFHDRPALRATVAHAPGWMWSAPARVAREGLAAVMRGAPVIVIGRANRLLVTVLRHVPRGVLRALARQAAWAARLSGRTASRPRTVDLA